MPYRRLATGLVGAILACVLLGCDSEESKPVGEPVEITPGMERMKEEMLKNYKAKTPGGARPAGKGSP